MGYKQDSAKIIQRQVIRLVVKVGSANYNDSESQITIN